MHWAVAVVGVLLVVGAGCRPPREPVAPLAKLEYPRRADQRAKCLVVMLPGYGDPPQVYERYAFIEAVRASGLDVDVEVADAHFGYYADRSIERRVHADLLAPARARGYREVWLLGVSMGATGALVTAQDHPDAVDGIVVFSPYLGSRRTMKAVRRAGGLAHWEPPDDAGDWDVEMWRWLKTGAARGGRPPIHLGYGTTDKGARGYGLIADVLPSAHVLTEHGGHGWVVWMPLWDRFLAEGPLRQLCS